MTNSPIAMLEREHQIILYLIHGLGRVCSALEQGYTVPPRVLYQSVAFLREFADRRHHAKEEDALFPAMVRAGIPERRASIEVMKAEHEQGRAAVTVLGKETDAYAEHGPAKHDSVVTAIAKIRTLYANHIFKEDHDLFPMAERELGAEEMAELAKVFARVDESFSNENHEQLVQFAQILWTTSLNRFHELS